MEYTSLNADPPNRTKKWGINFFMLCLGAAIALAIALPLTHKSSHDDSSDITPWDPKEYISVDEYYKDLDPHPITQRDNVRMVRISNPVPSPDGQWVVFAARQFKQPDSSKSSSTLWMSPIGDSAQAFQLTRPIWGVFDSSPQWSADGKVILFLSNRGKDGNNQIYQLLAPSGPSKDFIEPEALTSYPLDVDNLLLAPTNDVLAFSAQVYPSMSIEETVAQMAVVKSQGTGTVYEKLYMRHWDTWFDHRNNHPFVLALTRNSNGLFAVQGKEVDVLFGVPSDAPTRPYGGADEWSFAADGRRLAFMRQFDEAKNTSWQTDKNVWVADFSIEENGSPKVSQVLCVSCDNTAVDQSPAFHPTDRNVIMYNSMVTPQYESDRLRLRIGKYNEAAKSWIQIDQELTADWEYSVSSFVWSHLNPDSVFMVVEQEGFERLFHLNLNTLKRTVMTLNGTIGELQVTKDGLICTFNSQLAPSNVFLFRFNTSDLEKHPEKFVAYQFPTADFFPAASKCETGSPSIDVCGLTSLNSVALSKLQMGKTERFWYTGALGDQIMGWFIYPANFDPTKQYGVLFLAHGGPQGAWTDGWSYRWNTEVLAVQNNMIGVAINPHGSTGYGQKFCDSIRGNYGSYPYQDLFVYGYDAALAQLGAVANRSQIAAAGASYGGYSMNWLSVQPDTHTKFKCLVSHDGMSDLRNFYYSTEEVYFPEFDQMGAPWNATVPESYTKYDPLTYAYNMKTPMLIIHSAKDYRISEAQGIAMFTALQRQGVESWFLYYPDENHWVVNPLNSIYWYETVEKFLNTFAKQR